MDADKWTDKELKRLESRIKRIYSDAQADLSDGLDKYINGYYIGKHHYNGLIDRIDKEYSAYQKGFYDDKQYKLWMVAQEGRKSWWVDMRDQMCERLNNASKMAQDLTNGVLPKIYTKNSNELAKIATDSAMSQGVAGIRFDLVDEIVVRRLMMSSSEVSPFKPVAIDLPKEYTWSKNKLQDALLQGILQGDNIDKIADKMQPMFEGVTKNARASAVRSARTAVTGAQNAGKNDRYAELAEKGCEVYKIWVAVGDERTRDEHMEADGQEVLYDEPFEVGGEYLMYPADTSLGASGWNVFNCRCGMHSKITFKSILTDEQRAKANIRIIE